MHIRIACFCVCFVAASFAFDAHQLLQLNRLSSFKVRSENVLYTAYQWNETTNEKTTGLYLVNFDNVEQVVFREPGVAIGNPTWVDDDWVLFTMADENNVQNIFSCDIRQLPCVPQQISNYPVDVDNIQLSPDATRIAFSAYVYLNKSLNETAAIDAEKAKERAVARVFDRLFIRHWATWETGKWRHVHVAKFEGGDRAIGEARDVMPHDDGHCPSEPFGGNEEFAFSQDSNQIAYSVKMGKTQSWLVDNNLWIADVDGGAARCLSCENKGRDMNPVFSPDGTAVAWISTTSLNDESARNRIVIYNLHQKKRFVATEAWDRTVLSMTWSAEAPDAIYVTTYEDGRDKLFAVDVHTGIPTLIHGEHSVEAVAITHTQHGVALVMQISSYEGPAELFVAKLNGSNRSQLTNTNANHLEAALPAPLYWTFVGANNDRVQAWVFKPHNFEAGKKYPVALYCHGGPESPWSDQWSYRWNPQIIAAEGFALIAINFHGSPGWGDAFTKSILEDWGGKPFQDQLIGLQTALAEFEWMDEQRVVALGASYGGFTMNWMQGNAPQNMFRAFVLHDGIFNLPAMYYATEELWFPESEMGGTPESNPAQYARWSPHNYVQNWKTPMLVIHGEQDFRIPYTEGIAAFTTLQRKGIDSKLILFPNANHWVLEPNDSILWHKEVIAWIKQWTQ